MNDLIRILIEFNPELHLDGQSPTDIPRFRVALSVITQRTSIPCPPFKKEDILQ
tara:strand:- start:171 stop:332 length:162 start_codon:yes stop_codon:yes gene_type:complete